LRSHFRTGIGWNTFVILWDEKKHKLQCNKNEAIKFFRKVWFSESDIDRLLYRCQLYPGNILFEIWVVIDTKGYSNMYMSPKTPSEKNKKHIVVKLSSNNYIDHIQIIKNTHQRYSNIQEPFTLAMIISEKSV
jgi:hypothetical protein